jgi:hypothetical protein
MSDATCPPDRFSSGTTVTYRRSLSDYPADDGWVLTLYLAGKDALGKVAATDGADHVLTLTAADTGGLPAGIYSWVERVAKGGVVYDVGSGTVTVTANIAGAAMGSLQSWEEKALDALRAKLASRATSDQEEIQIDGRAIKRIPIQEIAKLIAQLEQRIKMKRPGAKFGRTVLLRFGRAGYDR